MTSFDNIIINSCSFNLFTKNFNINQLLKYSYEDVLEQFLNYSKPKLNQANKEANREVMSIGELYSLFGKFVQLAFHGNFSNAPQDAYLQGQNYRRVLLFATSISAFNSLLEKRKKDPVGRVRNFVHYEPTLLKDKVNQLRMKNVKLPISKPIRPRSKIIDLTESNPGTYEFIDFSKISTTRTYPLVKCNYLTPVVGSLHKKLSNLNEDYLSGISSNPIDFNIDTKPNSLVDLFCSYPKDVSLKAFVKKGETNYIVIIASTNELVYSQSPKLKSSICPTCESFASHCWKNHKHIQNTKLLSKAHTYLVKVNAEKNIEDLFANNIPIKGSCKLVQPDVHEYNWKFETKQEVLKSVVKLMVDLVY